MKKILLVFMALIGAMAGAPTTPITNGSFTGAGVVQTGASLTPTGTGTIRATSALSPAATNLTLGTASFGTGLTFTSATGAGVFAVSAASPFFASTNADVADAGAIRLGNGELIAWESSPAGTDVTLSVNSSEQFVFSNPLLSPQLITPALGVATATSLNGNFFTTGTYTLTGSAGKTLTFTNSLTLTGTDGTTITFPTTTAVVARTDAAQTFTGVQSMTSPAITTSLTSPSATFALLNVTPATINAFANATTINIGNAAGTTNLLGALNLNPSGSASGIMTLNGVTSGKTVYTTADATAQTVTVTTAAQTVGGSTLTVPDQAGTSRNYVFDTLAQTLTNKTLTAPVLGVATATSINGNIFTTGSSTYTGTAAQTYTFPTTSSTLAPIERPILMPSPATLLYRFDKASSTYNLSAATLKNLRARLAQAALGTGRLDIVSLGTSLSAGGGATETDKSGSWPKRLQRELVALGYPDGGTGFIGGQWNGTDSRVTLGSGWTALAAAQYSTVSGANTSGSLTIADNNPSTVIDVIYPDLYTFGASWTIDGAAQTDIPYANTLTLKKVTVSGLVNTPHTVVITPKTGTDGTHQLCITGVTFRQTTGVVCHVLGIGGITTASLASATFHAPRKVAVFIAPQLTMIETGANDGNPLPGTFSTNVTAIVTELLALSSDVVLMGENPTGAGTTGAAPLTIPLLYAIADTNNLAMVDWNDRLISWTSLSALGLGYVTDGFTLHLNSPGYAEEAKAALALFQPGGLGSTHLISFGTVPTIAAGAGAGTGPTVSVTGTDTAGTITVVSGTLPSVSSAIVTVTFNAAFGAAPRVVLWPANASASVLSFLPYVTSTTTTFVVNASTVALGGSTTYLYNYHVIQ